MAGKSRGSTSDHVQRREYSARVRNDAESGCTPSGAPGAGEPVGLRSRMPWGESGRGARKRGSRPREPVS